MRIGAPKERLLLTLLLCNANQTVSSARLIDVMWGDTPPRTARKNLQVYLSDLRKKIGARITFQSWGYRLHASPDELDALALHELARAGREASRRGDDTVAAAVLDEAVRLWRGQPLVEFSGIAAVVDAVGRLTDLYLSVYEDWAELEIKLGRPVDALRGLDALVTDHPTRERIVAARMSALVQCGRLSEALAQYETLRLHLAAELGVDPSPALRSLYQNILAGKELPSAPTPDRPPATRTGVVRWPTNQLPRDITDFVGRETETHQLTTQAAAVTLITGQVGTGKTALAVHVGHKLSPAFRDGVLMVIFRHDSSRRVDPMAIQREILAAAGLALPGVRDAIVAATWRSWLSDREILLVLDDVPDEASVRAFLPGTPASRVLVTSRDRLSGLESVVRIGLHELPVAHAQELLCKLFGDGRVHDDPAAVAAILGRCGRLPLSLRLLGGRFAGLPHVSLASIAERLSHAENALDLLVAGDVSLRDRFEQWYGDLPSQHREALLALGTLREPQFGFDELLAALDGDVAAAEHVIDSAFEANLLAVDGDGEVIAHSVQYSMPPPTHRFAVDLHAVRQGRARLH